jgi:hypothetical protein
MIKQMNEDIQQTFGQDVAKSQKGISLALIAFWVMTISAGWYLGFGQARQLDDMSVANSPVAAEDLMYRENWGPALFGYRFQLVRDGQPMYTIGELVKMRNIREEAFDAYKKSLARQRSMLDERTRDVVERLAVVPVPDPLKGTLTEEQVNTLRAVGIGEWAE